MAINYINDKKNSAEDSITWKALYRADRTIKTPFQIALADRNEILTCDDVIRIVPKKRLLAFGTWGDKEVAIKLFYGERDAERNAERDASGVELLMQANVPTAKLLYEGSIDKDRIHILIFEKINQGTSLATLWQTRKNLDDVRPLLHAVTVEIATQHVLGILQRDLHLNNFLVTEKTIYTLDGGQIECFENPLDKPLSIEYLALFLVQLGIGVEDLQQELFDVYTKSRGWIVSPADIKTFNKFLTKLAHERMFNYKKKIFRSCSAFNKVEKVNKKMMYDRQYESSEFKHLLSNPDAYVENPAAVVLKAGRSSTVVKIMVDGRPLVIKRYNIKNLWHGLRRCLRSSRAQQSWRIAQQLYASGVATPKPIAFIENKVLGFRGKSYFIMDYVEGQHVGNYFADHKNDLPACERMMLSTLALFKNLTKLRIIQGDLKMTNILIVNDTPHLIDFDGALEYFFNKSLNRAYEKELNRFMRNWENTPQIYALFDSLIHDQG